jgi:hypothetical protein
MPELLGLVVVLAIGWLVWDSLKAREIANSAIVAACRMERLQLLDYTVGLESMWPARDDEGRLAVKRVYGFEYSDTGRDRRKGSITLIGSNVLTLQLGARPSRDDATLH